jgi:uncharacterized cupin superfamily protein
MAAKKSFYLAALALGLAVVAPAALVAACSSSSGGNPTPIVYDANVATDSPTVTSDDASSSSSDSGQDVAIGPEDAATGDVREEPIVLEDAQACSANQAPAQGAPADAGCWSCAPQSTPEFLNQCAVSGVTCVTFDNSRVPGWDGGLPPSLN